MAKVLRFLDRHSQHEAIILRVYPIGELHAGVHLFSKESGIISAIAYGIRSSKSSLQGSIMPFARGRCTLYRKDENSWKIAGFEVEEEHQVLRQRLFAYCFASVWAELIWKTHAGMDKDTVVYQLFARALSAIGHCSQDEAYVLHAQFLWRYFYHVGCRPKIPHVLEGDYYLDVDNEIVQEKGRIKISPSILRFLHESEGHSFAELRQKASVCRQAKASWGFLKVFISQLLGFPLNSLRVAEEILL